MSDHDQNTLKSSSVSKQAAQDYLGTPQGKLFRGKLTEADPDASPQEIEMRAILYLCSQPELPKTEIQVINPAKLKAAAEHLEWVLKQYPNEAVVQDLYRALLPMIEAAKAKRVFEPVDRIPGGYYFSDGVYRPFGNPNVEDAYVDFSTEMEGGLTEDDKEILANIAAMQEAARARKDSK